MKKIILFSLLLTVTLLAACKKEQCKTCTVTQTITQNGQTQVGQTITMEACGDSLDEIKRNNYRQTVSTPDGMGGTITTDQTFDCQ